SHTASSFPKNSLLVSPFTLRVFSASRNNCYSFLYSGNWASVRYRCIRLKQDNILISRDSTQNKYFRLKSCYPSCWKVNNCSYMPADQRLSLITFSNLCGIALHSERSIVDF